MGQGKEAGHRTKDAGCRSSTWQQQDGSEGGRETGDSAMGPGLGPPGPDDPRTH